MGKRRSAAGLRFLDDLVERRVGTLCDVHAFVRIVKDVTAFCAAGLTSGRVAVCPECDGKGHKEFVDAFGRDWKDCGTCNGYGFVRNSDAGRADPAYKPAPTERGRRLRSMRRRVVESDEPLLDETDIEDFLGR